MTPAEALLVLLDLLRLPPLQRRAALLALPAPARRAIVDEWWWQAHGGQIEPPAGANGLPWRIWANVGARGFGKTRAGAEWTWARARADGEARIALVAASLDEVARVMVEGESGLLATARADERPRWIAGRGLLLFPSGAEAHAFSAACPEKLRGPQHHFRLVRRAGEMAGLGGRGVGQGQGGVDEPDARPQARRAAAGDRHDDAALDAFAARDTGAAALRRDARADRREPPSPRRLSRGDGGDVRRHEARAAGAGRAAARRA